MDFAAGGYLIQYQDSPNETLVTLTPAAPAPEEPVSDEPVSGEPASDKPAAPEEGALYGPEAAYQVEVDFQSRPEAGYGALKVGCSWTTAMGSAWYPP